jgi:MFS family permease
VTTGGGVRGYRELLAAAETRGVIGWGLVARLPMGMSALALVLLVRGAGGSYAAAGIASGAYAIASGVSAPIGGRLVDRRRPTAVLIVYGIVSGIGFAGLYLLAERHQPEGVLIAAAAVAGLLAPPISPTIRMMWPSMLPRPELRTTAFALEAVLQELLFVAGPLIVAALTTSVSSSAGVAAAGVAGTVGTLAFACTPAVRARRVDSSHDRSSHRLLEALTPWGVRRMLLYSGACGIAFGAAEVAMPAFAENHGGRSLGGIALAAFAGGSLIGGVFGGAAAAASARPDRRLQMISAAFTLALTLPLLAGSMLQMVVIMLIAGLPIAPSFAITYNLIEAAAVPGTQAEVFGWISTSITLTIAFGTAVGGSLIAHVGVHAALVLAIAGAALAMAISFSSPGEPARR